MDEMLFEDLEEEHFEFNEMDFEVMEMSEQTLMGLAERDGYIEKKEE